MENKWLDWAKERFARIREISAEEKNNEEQVRMCFRAAEDPNWKVLFE